MKFLDELDRFIHELELEAYRVGAGLKEEAEFSSVFDRADSLISKRTIDELKDAGLPPGELAEYLSFLLCMLIDKELKEPTDEVITAELSASAMIEGVETPYRQ
ncbi:MAG TPA: hypothetical protein PLQ76_04590, partial [bacterium]|nr:hypothetical protein [bacterium]